VQHPRRRLLHLVRTEEMVTCDLSSERDNIKQDLTVEMGTGMHYLMVITAALGNSVSSGTVL
jgi:hypothetical protein